MCTMAFTPPKKQTWNLKKKIVPWKSSVLSQAEARGELPFSAQGTMGNGKKLAVFLSLL